jgi:LCP family protein required for cell wall assembly
VDANGCGAKVEEGPSRTDTMIVVRVDPAQGKVAMLSIPRDLYVYIPANGYGNVVGAKKITTAHVYGTVYDDEGREVPHSGPELVKRTIRDNLGIPVHRYIRVDFSGFEQIVEAVGGIEVEVSPSPEDPSIGLYDEDYPDGHCGTMTINFPPGRQKLDGVQALQYARSRKSTSDFDRSRRQMQVLLAIRERGTRLGVILDLHKLIPALRETIDTDLTPDEIISLANTARGIDSEDVLRMQMDESVVYNDLLVIDDVPQYVLRLQQAPYDALREAFMNPASVLNAPPTEDPVEGLGVTEPGDGIAAP